jgi:hypothetical protein
MQDQRDIEMQDELDGLAKKIGSKTYSDYCQFEDDVADLIELHCPICQEEVDKCTIGRFVMWGSIRNYLRSKADIKFVNE